MARTLKSTPKKDGFRMPGEFEEHERSWLIWPERTDTWRDGAKPAQKVFVDVATKLVKYEPLTVLVSAQNPSCNPQLLVNAIEHYLPEQKPDFARTRRLEIYDEQGNLFR